MIRHTPLAVTLSALAVCAAPALAATVPSSTTFGSNNDGLGGFATDATSGVSTTPAPAWSLGTDGVIFTNDPTGPGATPDTGQVNGSLLQEFTLDRTSGSAYTITGVVDWSSVAAANNNRLGISLFADTGDLAGIDSGLSLQYNIGDGNMIIADGGVNSFGSGTVTAGYGGLQEAGVFTFEADVDYVGTDVLIDFTLTDSNNFSQTISGTFAAADLAGEFFGYGSRGRVRNGSDGFIYEAKSFDIAVIPEPGSMALLGLGGLFVLRRRRNK